MQPESTQQPNTKQSHQTGSLYVGDLEPNVTESVLFEIFRKIGPVASIRVCRDASTRRSLGYAYINYHRVEDAERALDILNYSAIAGGRACRIMWSQRDPSLRKSGQGNIFIKDLAPTIQSQDLYDNFSQFGTILSCKVETEDDGRSKGFGFVHFESVESAKKAIQAINGFELEGKKVHVYEFKPKTQREPSSSPKFTNIFLKNLHPSITDSQLSQKFSSFGTITSLVIMQNENGESKGFGFINYEKPEEAQRAIDEMNEQEFGGQKIFVGKAQKRSERNKELRKQFEERKLKYQESNLYIKNLDDQIDDKKLLQIFSVYGRIISAKVMKDENNLSKGFGFVCFSTPEEAQKAFVENGKIHYTKPLYVALAQRKEVRTAQLLSQYSHRQQMLASKNPYQPNPYQFNNNNPSNNPLQQQNKPFPPYKRWNNNKPPNQQPYNQQYNNQQGYHNYPRGPQKKQNIIKPTPSQQNNPLSSLSQLISQQTQPEEKKRIIGDFLYQKIDIYFQNNPHINYNDSGKITGMLLESLDEQELLNLAEDAKELASKIEEAVSVILESSKSSNDN